MFQITPQTGPNSPWQRCARLSYGFAALSLPIWAIPASSMWLIPFAILGAAAMILGAVSLYHLKRLPSGIWTRLGVVPAPLIGALAVMKLEYWWEKYS